MQKMEPGNDLRNQIRAPFLHALGFSVLSADFPLIA
jgi:hypothetical protein